ncbi:MAG: dimethyl sulfoxide reductase anchor subunit [Burkholderiaceae bacterium]|nr:dimethyl sulfoxide reductase anchor subunit [Burkholderiaceae bacterium]
MTLLALAMIAAGLALVGLELGRPLRAPNVFFHAETSWMTREAAAAVLLFALALAGVAARVPGLVQASALVGLVFLYCQARMLRAAKGIVAWREPALTPLIVSTGLAEGAALALAFGAGGQSTGWLPYLLIALLTLRAYTWSHYCGRLHLSGAPLAARDELSRLQPLYLLAGHALPIALLILGISIPTLGAIAFIAAALSGTGAGWLAKYWIIARASYQQGYGIGSTRRGVPVMQKGRRERRSA